MSKIIAACNQKGGVGKTTTCVNTSASLSAMEKKVLVVDMDPQGNATQGLGFFNEFEEDIHDALLLEEHELNKNKIKSLIRTTALPYLHAFPCSKSLYGLEAQLAGVNQKEFRLKKLLEVVREDYDFVLIDSPPSLSTLTLNVLTAADSVIIPIQCEYYALQGLAELLNTIRLVQQRLNPNLTIEGALLTMFDGRLNLSKQVAEEVGATFSEKVFKTVIPRSVKLSEAPSFGKPILLYDAMSVGAVKYMELASEIINHVQEGSR